MSDTVQYVTPVTAPGPTLPAWMQALLWGAWPVRYLSWCARRYGPSFAMRFPGDAPGVVVTDPDDIRALFALRPDEFTTSQAAGPILEPFLGAQSLLLLDGERHRQERRMLVHAFRADHMAAHAATVREVAQREVGCWPVGREMVLHEAAQGITLDVILRVVFAWRARLSTRSEHPCASSFGTRARSGC